MTPRDKVEIVMARFTFVSYINPLYPRISVTRKKHSPSASITQVRDWFDRVISLEKSQLPDNTTFRYCDWRFMCGDPSIFTVNGRRFDKLLLVLGEETVYWVFYPNYAQQSRIEGCAAVPLTFCPCCFSSHYMKIIKIINDNVTSVSQSSQ